MQIISNKGIAAKLMTTHEELLARLNADLPPTGILLGAEILELDPSGRVRMSFVATPAFCNPNGTVQGGIVAAMLDDAAEMACVADAGKRIFVATIEMKVSFLLPAKAGKLYAEGRVIKRGRMIAFLEADLFDGEGALLARMTSTAAPRAF